jgi:hypothetical protein
MVVERMPPKASRRIAGSSWRSAGDEPAWQHHERRALAKS